MIVDPLSPLPLFTPLPRLTRLVAALCVLMAAVSWMAAGYDLGEVRRLLATESGASLEPSEIQGHSRAGRIMLGAQLGCAALLATAFVPWLYQSRVNVRALGLRRLRWGREWTYLGLILPVVNLFRPGQVVGEIWRASDPATLDPVSWQERRTPALVWAWWGLLVVWVLAEIVSGLVLRLATGLSRVQLAHALSLAGDVSAALSASLATLLVLRLWRAQQAKRAAIDLPTGN